LQRKYDRNQSRGRNWKLQREFLKRSHTLEVLAHRIKTKVLNKKLKSQSNNYSIIELCDIHKPKKVDPGSWGEFSYLEHENNIITW
jgi:hypothetical protein